MRVLTDADVAAVLDLPALLEPVADALRAQRDGRVERPDRPHFPVGVGLPPDGDGGGDGRTGDGDDNGAGDGGGGDGNDAGDGGDGHGDDGGDGPGRGDGPPRGVEEPAGTALTMPAYVHGAGRYATKLVSVHEGNADRGLPTVRAQIAVTDAATGRPAAFLDGTRITNARTGCVGGLAVRHLADRPVELGVIGAGTQARWQVRAIDAATDLTGVRVYSPSDSRRRCAWDLRERGIDARAVDTPRAAVAGADAVVTATTATEPVFPGVALAPGAVVVAVGAYTPEMRELDGTTLDRARAVYADVPEEAATVGDLAGRYDAADLRPIADAFDGEDPFGDADHPDRDGPPGDDAAAGRDGGTGGADDGTEEDADGDVVVVESVGSAVMDAAAAGHVLDRVESGEDGDGRGVAVAIEAGPEGTDSGGDD